MAEKDKHKMEWPEPGMDYSCNVGAIVRDLERNGKILGAPCGIKRKKAMADLVNNPARSLKTDISED